jgi:hypothetical protein
MTVSPLPLSPKRRKKEDMEEPAQEKQPEDNTDKIQKTINVDVGQLIAKSWGGSCNTDGRNETKLPSSRPSRHNHHRIIGKAIEFASGN